MSIPSTHPAIADAIRKGLVVDRTPPAPKRQKYNNTPTTIDGIRYDSAKEARHGQLLAAMQRDGLISDLRRQVRFPLKVNGVLICTYVADFVFRALDGRQIVQDVKGYKTDVYKIKKKLLLAVNGIEIIEV